MALGIVGAWHVRLQPRRNEECRYRALRAQAICIGGGGLETLSSLPVKLSNAPVTEFGDGVGPLQFPEGAKALHAHAAGRGSQAVRSTGCRAFISRRTHHRTSHEQSPAGSPNPPGTKFAEICIYPLGIVRKRPYDSGLSFSAQMQIGVEGGV